LRARSSRFNW